MFAKILSFKTFWKIYPFVKLSVIIKQDDMKSNSWCGLIPAFKSQTMQKAKNVGGLNFSFEETCVQFNETRRMNIFSALKTSGKFQEN